MINFIISVSDFQDAITLKEWGLVDAHIEWAEKTVKNGGKVIFEQRYENASADTIMEISTKEDLKNWKNKVSEVIKLIEKIKKKNG
jgi:hypothetical protein